MPTRFIFAWESFAEILCLLCFLHVFFSFFSRLFVIAGVYEHVIEDLQLYREHSTAQHSTTQSPLQTNCVTISVHIKRKYVSYLRPYMQRPGCFPEAWSSWRLQVACLHLEYWTVYCIRHSVPFFLVSERSGPPPREAPCTAAIATATAIHKSSLLQQCYKRTSTYPSHVVRWHLVVVEVHTHSCTEQHSCVFVHTR